MTASIHTILARSKQHAAGRAMREDFKMNDGKPTTSNLISNELGWSLYCLDQNN
jgi:hypothetical protein